MQKYILFIILMVMVPSLIWAAERHDDSAVALLYYQIDSAYDSGSLNPDIFDQHLKLLASERYNVMSLDKILSNLRHAAPIPDNAVALTFEGAFKSNEANAFKKLIELEIPFTVFFASDRIDRNSPHYMSWDDLRALMDYPFVTFGLLPSGYIHMPTTNPAQIKKSINLALSRAEEELELRPEYLAIPYGIYTKENLDLIASYGFKAIFGQHSGVLSSEGLDHVLPRFSMTDGYGDTDRFETIARSKPLHLMNITPEGRYLSLNEPQDNLLIGFSTPDQSSKSKQPNCFASDIGKVDLQKIGDSRYQIKLPLPLEAERLRINCTQPYEQQQAGEMPRSKWYGMLFQITQPGIAQDNEFFSE